MAVRAAQLMVEVGADTSDAERNLDALSDRLGAVGRTATMTGGLLTAGLTLPLAGVAKTALDAAIGYESSMNLMQAVSGATAEQMAAVGQRAKELGADMTLPGTSAADAALAMTELAKAGLSVDQSMAAAKGVLQLSAAGAVSNAEAAAIAAAALNAFGLAGSEATRVADLLAAAANASASDVRGLSDGFRMAASVFSMTGQTVDTLTASLALMSNAGIAGSDAGTSLKQMMLSLSAPTQTASKTMDALGISVYDAQGAMLPMRDIIEQFSTRLAGMSQQQRNAALSTIFGADAIRAANVVLMGGVQAWDAMTTAVTRQGAAADLAGARMKGLGGALEGLRSQVETTLLNIAEPALGVLEGWVRGVADLIGGIDTLNPALTNAAIAFGVVLAAAGPVLLAFGALTTAVAFLLSPLGLLIATTAAVAAAFAGLSTAGVDSGEKLRDALGSVLTWVSETVPQLVGQLGEWGRAFVEWVAPMVPPLLAELGQLANAVFDWVMSQVGPLINQLGEWGSAFVEWVAPQVPPLLRELLGLASSLLAWVAAKAPDILRQFLGEWAPAAIGWVAHAVLLLLRELPSIIVTLAEFVVQNVPTVFQFFIDLGKAIVDGITAGVKNLAGQLFDAVWNMAAGAVNAAKQALGISSPSRVFEEIGEDIIEGMVEGIEAGQDQAVAAARSVAQAAGEEAKAAVARINQEILAGAGALVKPVDNQAMRALLGTSDMQIRAAALFAREIMTNFQPGDVVDLETGKTAQHLLDERIFPLLATGVNIFEEFSKLGLSPATGFTFLGKTAEGIANLLFLLTGGKLPGLRHGGDILRAGLAMVGERGPELLSLPEGARVAPLPAGAGGSPVSVTVVVQGNAIYERDLAETVRAELLRLGRRNLSVGLA